MQRFLVRRAVTGPRLILRITFGPSRGNRCEISGSLRSGPLRSLAFTSDEGCERRYVCCRAANGESA
jgi:hypothetical protein